MMEGVESKKITTKFGNKVKFCTSGGCITPRNKSPLPSLFILVMGVVSQFKILLLLKTELRRQLCVLNFKPNG